MSSLTGGALYTGKQNIFFIRWRF